MLHGNHGSGTSTGGNGINQFNSGSKSGDNTVTCSNPDDRDLLVVSDEIITVESPNGDPLIKSGNSTLSFIDTQLAT